MKISKGLADKIGLVGSAIEFFVIIYLLFPMPSWSGSNIIIDQRILLAFGLIIALLIYLANRSSRSQFSWFTVVYGVIGVTIAFILTDLSHRIFGEELPLVPGMLILGIILSLIFGRRKV